jgi:outer membrane murein-binding lipoprotein Lpp
MRSIVLAGKDQRMVNTITIGFLLFITYKLIKMADKETILASFNRIQSGLTNLAGDIRSLKDGIQPGMSQADVDELSTRAETLASNIEALAAETPEAAADNADVDEPGAGGTLKSEEPLGA